MSHPAYFFAALGLGADFARIDVKGEAGGASFFLSAFGFFGSRLLRF